MSYTISAPLTSTPVCSTASVLASNTPPQYYSEGGKTLQLDRGNAAASESLKSVKMRA